MAGEHHLRKRRESVSNTPGHKAEFTGDRYDVPIPERN